MVTTALAGTRRAAPILACMLQCALLAPVAIVLLGCRSQEVSPAPTEETATPRAFDIEVFTQDAESGEPVSLVIIDFPFDRNDSGQPPWKMKGMSLHSTQLSGTTSEPWDLNVSGQGYQQRTVQIHPGQTGSIVVELQQMGRLAVESNDLMKETDGAVVPGATLVE